MRYSSKKILVLSVIGSKILSVHLALLLLMATTPIAVSKHYCCDFLVNLSILKESKNCAEALDGPYCTGHKDDTELSSCDSEKKGCCHDENELSYVNKLEFKTSIELDAIQDLISVSHYLIYIINHENLKQNVVPFIDYNAPWVIRDIIILHETYLI